MPTALRTLQENILYVLARQRPVRLRRVLRPRSRLRGLDGPQSEALPGQEPTIESIQARAEEKKPKKPADNGRTTDGHSNSLKIQTHIPRPEAPSVYSSPGVSESTLSNLRLVKVTAAENEGSGHAGEP
ncbi:hypothetical protein KM043_006510 [Ampulex compressa]|nr:hypothetical protein KM043_006510 [Ampulex compressa]